MGKVDGWYGRGKYFGGKYSVRCCASSPSLRRILTLNDYGLVVTFRTSVLLFCSDKQMSFFVNKGHASRSELPINNLSQQLGKFRKEKSKPNTGPSIPGLITTKQKSQNQG